MGWSWRVYLWYLFWLYWFYVLIVYIWWVYRWSGRLGMCWMLWWVGLKELWCFVVVLNGIVEFILVYFWFEYVVVNFIFLGLYLYCLGWRIECFWCCSCYLEGCYNLLVGGGCRWWGIIRLWFWVRYCVGCGCLVYGLLWC